ncbi:MAG TPA: hypothetical protein VGM11_03260 [Acidobacteriaceae bacterium]|jgi:hypothetical protein
MVTASGSRDLLRRETGLILLTLVFIVPLTSSARASGPDEAQLDVPALNELEQRADAAQPRDQCYMFAEVLHGLTELAGREIAAGDDQGATVTLLHLDSVAAKMEKASAVNPKRLKNAEMLLEHITRRLSDMAHVASAGQRSATQAALQQVDRLHTQVLAVLFSK